MISIFIVYHCVFLLRCTHQSPEAHIDGFMVESQPQGNSWNNLARPRLHAKQRDPPKSLLPASPRQPCPPLYSNSCPFSLPSFAFEVQPPSRSAYKVLKALRSRLLNYWLLLTFVLPLSCLLFATRTMLRHIMDRLLSYSLGFGLPLLQNPTPNSNYAYGLPLFTSLPLKTSHHISSILPGHGRVYFFMTLLFPSGSLIVFYRHSSRSLHTY